MSKPRKSHSRWPLYLIGSSAAVAVWSGWVGLGEKTGFGPVHLLPGIWDSLVINTAITLPVGVEAYGAYALGAWIDRKTPETARKFAKMSALGSLGLGMLGQVAYHLLSAFHRTVAPWEIVTAVSILPVITLGFAAALYHLKGTDDEEEQGQPAVELPPAAPGLSVSREGLTELEREPFETKVPPYDLPQRRAPWDTPDWAPPKPVFVPVDGPDTDTFPVQQPMGTVNVRSPLSRAERKVPYDERVNRTGSFQAIE